MLKLVFCIECVDHVNQSGYLLHSALDALLAGIDHDYHDAVDVRCECSRSVEAPDAETAAGEDRAYLDQQTYLVLSVDSN